MNRNAKIVLAMVPLAFALACTDPAKAPAEAALKAAETAVASMSADAEKWAPDQVKAVRDALAQAKEAAGKKDFKGALAAARAVPDQVKQVLAAAEEKAKAAVEEAKKLELTKAWESATAALPNLIQTAKSRIAILSQARKLPAGLDKAKLAKAKESLAAIEASFQKASEDFKGGAIEQATTAVGGLQAQGEEVLTLVGARK